MPNASQPVAIVTGSSRGIGRAIALELAKSGHHVVVNYAKSAEAAEAVVQEIAALGSEAIAVQADVSKLGEHERLTLAALHRWKRLDVLVNNAGITSPGRKDLLDATPESWDEVFATNLKGPFFLAQRAAREMIACLRDRISSRATIINVSSISAYAVSTNRADYCIAKSAMQMLTWQLATRLADEGILVYEVCPGVIASDMTAPVKAKYDRLIEEGLSPLRRWGQPDDVARAVAMLAGGALPFSTGERINVDGGFHIRRL
jgi:NAD(P)-dependent dehydrogenase (short-subunit alcohol dehydrogenase family)